MLLCPRVVWNIVKQLRDVLTLFSSPVLRAGRACLSQALPHSGWVCKLLTCIIVGWVCQEATVPRGYQGWLGAAASHPPQQRGASLHHSGICKSLRRQKSRKKRRMLVTILVSWGCHNSTTNGCHKQQKYVYVSQFWRLQVQNQRVIARVGSF